MRTSASMKQFIGPLAIDFFPARQASLLVGQGPERSVQELLDRLKLRFFPAADLPLEQLGDELRYALALDRSFDAYLGGKFLVQGNRHVLHVLWSVVKRICLLVAWYQEAIARFAPLFFRF